MIDLINAARPPVRLNKDIRCTVFVKNLQPINLRTKRVHSLIFHIRTRWLRESGGREQKAFISVS